MKGFPDAARLTVTALLLLCSVLFVCGCATEPVVIRELPPLLAQDELLRPYQKIATIEVRRSRWGYPEDLTPADYDWAYEALQQEAARIGAHAVIIPEVKVELHRYLFFPTSEIKAKGIGIKFQ